jgi:hypothetical protein
MFGLIVYRLRSNYETGTNISSSMWGMNITKEASSFYKQIPLSEFAVKQEAGFNNEYWVLLNQPEMVGIDVGRIVN